jgi:hypothetical protein
VGEGLSLALLLGVAGELARRRTAGEWQRNRTLGRGDAARVMRGGRRRRAGRRRTVDYGLKRIEEAADGYDR